MAQSERKFEIHSSVLTMQTRLAQLMERKANDSGLSDSEIANQIGIAKSTLSKYKSNDVIPRIDKLYTIAKYFGVSADYLLGLQDDPTPDPNMKMITQKMGLSEQAVNAVAASLQKTKSPCLSIFFERAEGVEFLEQFAQYYEICQELGGLDEYYSLSNPQWVKKHTNVDYRSQHDLTDKDVLLELRDRVKPRKRQDLTEKMELLLFRVQKAVTNALTEIYKELMK